MKYNTSRNVNIYKAERFNNFEATVNAPKSYMTWEIYHIDSA